MLIEGEATIGEYRLEKRDAAGFWNFYDPLNIQLNKNSKLLAIEVPMR